MKRRTGTAVFLAIATVAFASSALSDVRGVGAKIVQLLQTPTKSRVKVILGGEGAADIHKGAAGDGLLTANLSVCVDGTSGFFTTAAPWKKNTDAVAKYSLPAGPSQENFLKKAIVKPGKSAKWIAHESGGLNLQPGLVESPPAQGGVSITITNANDGSSHRLCTNLETAETVQDRTIAGGTGRKITWRNAGPDPDCIHFDQLFAVICSPSGAFLDGADGAFF